MSKYQTAAALIATAWVAYHLGKRAAAACNCNKATAVATLDADTWNWLNAVGSL